MQSNTIEQVRIEILRQLQQRHITPADASDLLTRIGEAQQVLTRDLNRVGVIYSYSRVSTDSQADNLTCDAHRSQTAHYAEYLVTKEPGKLKQGVYFFESGVSAFTRRLIVRPEGAKLHRLLRPGDHVVFAKLNRAFRNTRDFLDTYALWDKMGVSIHFLDVGIDLSTATGRMVATMLASFAEWESALKGEVRKANNVLRRQFGGKVGRHTRRAHKSIRHKGRIIELPDRRGFVIAKYIWLAKEQAKLSFAQISDRLEACLAKREGRAIRPVFKGREFDRCRVHKWHRDYRKGKFNR